MKAKFLIILFISYNICLDGIMTKPLNTAKSLTTALRNVEVEIREVLSALPQEERNDLTKTLIVSVMELEHLLVKILATQ
ncbi:hypothetical protein ILUMI_15845 [Ignelater luminosus]|uniref:Uncharacterized protein n=1 Tax=Ignelater luminosus TaxID=2038154 RepID=A0A8K0CPP4_IGNLU|nr:hypothetical protein ILUMI_15845 [Ignelater luminosus]